MARSTVELIVDASKAVNPLRKVQQQARKLEQAFDKNGRAANRLGLRLEAMGRKGVRSLKNLEKNAASLGKRMRTVGTAVKGAAVAFAAYKSIQTGISRIESQRRLKLVAQNYGEVASLQLAAANAAQKFNLGQTEANLALSDAFARLRPLGVSLEDITSTFNGFRTAAILGGATAAEASASFTQLSQALGSGALRGDEFRSISEQAPLVLQAISDETGIAAGKLKDYASEGLLTSDIVIKALKRIEEEGAGRLTEALSGPEAQIKKFQNAVEDVAAAATETIVPQLATAFSDLAVIIKNLEGPIRFIGGLLGGIVSQVAKVTTRLRRGAAGVEADMAAAEAAGRQVPFSERIKPGGLKKFNEIYQKELARRMAIVDGAVPGQLPASAADLPGKTGKTKPTSTLPPLPSKPTSKKRTEAEKERLRIQKLVQRLEEDALETQRRQAQSFEDQRRSVDERRMIQLGILNGNKKEVENAVLLGNLQRDYGEQKGMQLYLEELNVQKLEEQNRKRKEAADAQKENVEELKRLYESLGQTVATSVVDNLIAAVDQTKSLGEALSGVLRSIGDQLLSFGVGKIGTGIGNLLGDLFKADGGPVRGGRSYIVGERGPEVFTPGSGGTIVPNNALSGGGGGVNVGTINISVENTGEQLSPQAQKQLAGQVKGIVLSTLANERRSGGML